MHLYLGQSLWHYFINSTSNESGFMEMENTAVVEAENVRIAVAKKLLRCWCWTVIIILLECDHL